ncbi:MAG: hypothetical protein KJO21_13050 [Verrucomicrobiae bacterium]|nr:hypothetical protein [Verrucomicrobiae bacterium]NNJ44234.1 hypothetical protein [Akkermansiaceae bacterium]
MMRLTRFPLSLLALLAMTGLMGMVSAKPPQKPNMGQFTGLISQSPFTIKPKAATQKVDSPLERDWMLGSIRPSGRQSGSADERYLVTIINKKNRKERIRFIPGFSAGGFQLLDVEQDTESNENSRVSIGKGSQKAWITYDDKLIKVRPSTTAKAPTKKPTNAGRRISPPIPGRSTTRGNKKPSPRVRHVPRTNR